MKSVILYTCWTTENNAVSIIKKNILKTVINYSVYYIGLAWWVWFLLAVIIIIAIIGGTVGFILVKCAKRRPSSVKPMKIEKS